MVSKASRLAADGDVASLWPIMRIIVHSASDAFNLIVHKPDKKREKVVLSTLRSSALNELQICYDMSQADDDPTRRQEHLNMLLQISIQLLFHEVHTNSWTEPLLCEGDALIVVEHIEKLKKKLASQPQLVGVLNSIKSYLESNREDTDIICSATRTLLVSLR